MVCAKSAGDLWPSNGGGGATLRWRAGYPGNGVIRHIATLAMPSVFHCVHRLGRVSYLTTCSRQRWDMNNQIAGIWDDILAMARIFMGFFRLHTGNVIGKRQLRPKCNWREELTGLITPFIRCYILGTHCDVMDVTYYPKSGFITPYLVIFRQ